MNVQQALEVAREAMKHLEDAADCLGSLEAELGDLPVGQLVAGATLPLLQAVMGPVHGAEMPWKVGTLEAVISDIEAEAGRFERAAERRTRG